MAQAAPERVTSLRCQSMGSVPDYQEVTRRIEIVAKQVAIEFRLPWRLPDLRKHGWYGVSWANHTYDQRLCLPFPQYAWRYIRDAVRRRAELISTEEDTESAKKTPPPEGWVRDALETFSKKEWILLIKNFGREDLDPLRDYLDANREELERSPNWKRSTRAYSRM